MADDIRGFIAALELDRPVVLGHSVGGDQPKAVTKAIRDCLSDVL